MAQELCVAIDVWKCFTATWSESTDEPELLLLPISISRSSSSLKSLMLSSVSAKVCFLYFPGCWKVGTVLEEMALGGTIGGGDMERASVVSAGGVDLMFFSSSEPSVWWLGHVN